MASDTEAHIAAYANPLVGQRLFCTDCKNATDNSVAFDSNMAASGSGTVVVYENGHWRVH